MRSICSISCAPRRKRMSRFTSGIAQSAGEMRPGGGMAAAIGT